MSEDWRPISMFEGLYEISKFGEVRSLKTNTILKGSSSGKSGYRQIALYKDKKLHWIRIHRAVLEAFVGPAPAREVAHHKDHNKLNNTVENLEWCSQSKNVRMAVCIGIGRGSDHGGSKLSESQVIKILAMAKQGASQKKIAEDFGVTRATINGIVCGREWTHVARY